MKSIPLIRFVQVMVILIQFVGLTFFGDLCTGFEPVQSCQVETPNYGIERYCLPFGITDIRSLFTSDVALTAKDYVVLYTGIWILLSLADLLFAIIFCLEKQSKKDSSFSSSLVICLLELGVLIAQIVGSVFLYNSWDDFWNNEYYSMRLPLNFHIAFFIAATLLLMVVFEEFVVSPRLYFVRREQKKPANDANNGDGEDEEVISEEDSRLFHPTATTRTMPSTNYTNRTQTSVSTAY